MEAEEYARLQGWGPEEKKTSDGESYWVLRKGAPCDHIGGKCALYQSGFWRCKKCVSGIIDEIRGHKKKSEQSYTPGPIDDLKAAQKHLAENPDSAAARHLYGDRGLAGATVAEFRLGVVNGMPAIPVFDSAGRFLAHKLRDLDPKTKRKYSWSRKGATSGYTLFNAHKLDRTLDYVYVTEGEFDCMAMWQMHFRNVVSLPHGADKATLPDGMAEELDGFSRIFLLYDPDAAGRKTAKAHAEALGVWRTARVLLPGRDINAALKVHSPDDFERWIALAQQWEGGVKAFDDPLDTEIDLYGKEIEKCPEVPWPKMQWLMSGFRPGEITVLSGDTGVGKTTKALEICWHLSKQGIGTYIISAEMQPRDLARKLLQFEGGKPLLYPGAPRGDDRYLAEPMQSWDVEAARERLRGLPIYHSPRYGAVDTPVLRNDIMDAVRRRGCKLVVVDHLQFILDHTKQYNEYKRQIDVTLEMLTALAHESQIHVILVCHPRKAIKGNDLKALLGQGPEDLTGSNYIKQCASNIWWIYKHSPEIIQMRVWKARAEIARCGSAWFTFDPETLRIKQMGQVPSADELKTIHRKYQEEMNGRGG